MAGYCLFLGADEVPVNQDTRHPDCRLFLSAWQHKAETTRSTRRSETWETPREPQTPDWISHSSLPLLFLFLYISEFKSSFSTFITFWKNVHKYFECLFLTCNKCNLVGLQQSIKESSEAFKAYSVLLIFQFAPFNSHSHYNFNDLLRQTVI